MPTRTTRYSTNSNGNRVAYSLSGPYSAPCIVLIHGWAGGRYEFDSVIEPLNDAGFRTCSMDMPGHQDSDNVTDRSAYSMSGLADIIHDLMLNLALCPAFVLGFSMGGAVVDELAIRYPVDVKALILLGSAGFDWEDDQAQLEIDEAEPIVFSQGMEAHYDVWKQRTGEEQYAAFDAAELNRRRKAWARTSADAYVGTLYGLRDKRDTLPDLAALSKPTLIVHGEKDEDSVRSTSEAAHRAMTSSTYHAVPGAAHFAHDDNTQDFVSAVVEFLKNVR